MVKKASKIVAWLVGILLSIFLLVWILLHIPAIQNTVVNKVTQRLSQMLNTEVAMESVNIRFFKTVALKGIYVEDQQQDTLLCAKELQINIGLLDLLNNTIQLGYIGLQGATIQLHRPEQDSVFNYQFLIDAFASDSPDTTTSSSPWSFGLYDLAIENTNFRMLDENAGTDLDVSIGEFFSTVEALRLDSLALAIDRMELRNSNVAYRIFKEVPSADTTTNEAVVFPELGFPLQVDKLRLSENTLIYDDQTAAAMLDALDFAHLNFQQLAIAMDDFNWDAQGIRGIIQNIAFQDHSGFTLEETTAEVQFTPQLIEAQGFRLKTPQSDIRNSTTLRYNNFNELVQLTEDVALQTMFENSQLAFDDLAYFTPSITKIKQLNTDLQQTIKLEGQVSGTFANLQDIVLKLSVSNAVRLQASGSLQNVLRPEEMRYTLSLDELSTSYDDLQQLTQNIGLPTGLDALGRFTLAGNFRGNLDSLIGKNVRLNTASYTALRGDLKLDNLTNPNDLRFYLDVEELRSQASDLAGFAEGDLPPEVYQLGQMRYVGEASGTTQKFLLTGDLETEAGTAVMDVFLGFNADCSDAEYEGELDLQNFQLDKVLADTTLGSVTLAVAGSGEGLSLDSLQVELEGVIVSAEYQNYTYENIRLNGAFQQREFIGRASMDDQNLQFAFQGDVNLNDSVPIFQFTAKVDTINLQALNLYPTPLSLSSAITANLSGSTIDDLNGTASIKNFRISNQTYDYQTDTILLQAFETDTGRVVVLTSAFLNARLQGDYQTAELPRLVRNFINDYFPLDRIISPADTPDSLTLESKPTPPVADQRFTFSVELDDPVPLLRLFVPALEQLDTAFVTGTLDSEKRNLEIHAGFPKLKYQNISIGKSQLNANGSPKQIRSVLQVDQLELTDSLRIAMAEAEIRLGDDSLHLDFFANQKSEFKDSTFQLLTFGGTATELDGTYRFVWEEQFVLNNEDWQIPTTNIIRYRPDFLDINNFALSRPPQRLAIKSEGEAVEDDFAPIVVTFSDFELAKLFQLVGFSPKTFQGRINGNVRLRQLQTNLNYLANLQVNDILLYNEPLGDLTVEAEQLNPSSPITIDGRLEGARNDASVQGSYALTNNSFDLQANLERLELRIADPFSEGLLQQSEGTLSGNFTIQGTPEAPAVNGTLALSDISTTVGITQVRYRMPEQEEVQISSSQIEFGTIRLEDENGNPATLQGVIRHQYFTDIAMDLDFNTNRFQVLNTTAEDEDLYYGRIFTSGNVQIQGSPTLPRIDARAQTLAPTQLFVQPLTVEETGAQQEDYVIFADPETYTADAAQQRVAYQIDRSGIDLSLNLEVTPEAELQIVIDPASGDKLVARGNSELTVEMNPTGTISLLGSYRIENGQYTFNYQGLTKRNFEIRQGSRLEFVGDPLDTRFNVSAIYTARTPIYPLIRNQVTALSEQQVQQSKMRTPVNVMLSMLGDLNSPEVSFDITLPEAEGSPVTGVTQQALTRLRDNPTELNKQVFGLLLFNSFFSEEQSGGTLVDAGSSIYLSSVSNLVSNQLNRLAEKYVEGININVGVESYQSDYALENQGNTITEVQLGLSKQLFDDRLTVKVGGNVNVNSKNALLVEGANFSSIAGNFVLEYKLTESGNYRLRVFRKENYDALNQSNVARTGVSFFLKKSFQGKKNKKREKQPEEDNAKPEQKESVRTGEQSPTIERED